MTPERRAAETANKRAERQRREERGEKRVEVWLGAESLAVMDRYCKIVGLTRSDLIERALKDYIQ